MKKLILNERQKIASEKNLVVTDIRVTLALASKLLRLGINYLLTRWYLRKVNEKGKILFTNRKPDIQNEGFIRIGNITRIWSNVNRCRLSVKKGGKLYIGDNCRINGPVISVTDKVFIGNNCRIAPQVYIMDGDFHAVEDRLSKGSSKPIIIEDDAWVATRAMVLKGVRIGKGAVVAAGAVVTKDVPPYTIAAGVPAKIIKHIHVEENTIDHVLDSVG
jgi:maltose O-acetyltransferase